MEQGANHRFAQPAALDRRLEFGGRLVHGGLARQIAANAPTGCGVIGTQADHRLHYRRAVHGHEKSLGPPVHQSRASRYVSSAWTI